MHFSRNSGKAEAVRRGILAALDDSPEYVGFWDADLATPLDEIPHFCRVLDEHPGSGSSSVLGYGCWATASTVARCGTLGRLMPTWPASSRVGIYDTQCGAKLFRADRHAPRVFRSVPGTLDFRR